jgi:hypothetical protein
MLTGETLRLRGHLYARLLALAALSFLDAVCTTAEAHRFGSWELEANPAMLAILHWGGAPGMLAVKALPLGALAVLMILRPMPRVVLALVGVYAVLLCYHGVLYVAA